MEQLTTGRELDALVAEKVMGYKLMRWIAHPEYEPVIIDNGSGAVLPVGLPIPNYSTDIAAAWQVVEKLNWPYFELSYDSVTWTFRMSDGEQNVWGSSDLDNPSPMLAICRAALKAVGVDYGTS